MNCVHYGANIQVNVNKQILSDWILFTQSKVN